MNPKISYYKYTSFKALLSIGRSPKPPARFSVILYEADANENARLCLTDAADLSEELGRFFSVSSAFFGCIAKTGMV